MTSFFTIIALCSLSTLYSAFGIINLIRISTAELSPYIDEIFHVGQGLKYCGGNFKEYDPKLTTPPGLYLISLSILKPLSILTGCDLCTIHGFRCFNFAFSVFTFSLLYRIIKFQPHYYTRVKNLRIALNLCTFPVLYFFSFFYYTDVISTFLVLATYYFYNIGRSHSAGLAGLLSVTVRQTNIVWFCCFAFIRCCRQVENEISKNGRFVTAKQRRQMNYILFIIKECLNLLRNSFGHFIFFVLKETYLFILSVVCFVFLIVQNGSLVLGDKSNHEPVIHVLQLLYFSLFTSVFAFPLCFRPSFKLLKNFKKFKLRLGILAIFCALVIAVNTMEHLFLISDNRHYTFYIWKRIFRKTFGRYILIPLYIVSVFSIIDNTNQIDSYVKLAYVISTVICLVPQKLLEFRYFIIPYLLYRLETCSKLTNWQLNLELAFNIILNYLTISLFVKNPFQWPDGTIQRFSW